MDILKANSGEFDKNSNFEQLEHMAIQITNKLLIMEFHWPLINQIYKDIDSDHTYEGKTAHARNHFPMVNNHGFRVFDDYLPYTRGCRNSINDIRMYIY